MTNRDGAARELIERVATPSGEYALRRAGRDLELIAGGVFLMSSADVASARLHASAPLARHPAPRRVLIAGLGLGATAAEALADPRVEEVVVVELEDVVVRWQRDHAASVIGPVVGHPRVTVVVADFARVLDGAHPIAPVDVACVDVDNGPGWTVIDENEALYHEPALRQLAGLLTPGGIVSFWSASADPAFTARLESVFSSVDEHEVPVARGEPDRVLVAGPQTA